MENHRAGFFARIRQSSPKLHSKNEVSFPRPSAVQQNPPSVKFSVGETELMTPEEGVELQERAFLLQHPAKKLGHCGESDDRASPCQSVSAYF